jgi:hypothetical protein
LKRLPQRVNEAVRAVSMTLVRLTLTLVLLWPITVSAASMTDAEVRKAMIQESIASYPGHCPCPYNLASNGSRCGKRSAWSKPGGYAPLCYPADISDDMVRQYRTSPGLSGQ